MILRKLGWDRLTSLDSALTWLSDTNGESHESQPLDAFDD